MSFNILADKVVRYWLSITIDDNGAATMDGLGRTVSDMLALLYADDTLIAATDPQWLQQALNLLVQLFCRMGLDTNVAKTKLMLCDCGFIPTAISNRAYLHRITGTGPSFQDHLQQKTTCMECSKCITIGALPAHLRCIHGQELPPLPTRATTDTPTTYNVDFPPKTTAPCPHLKQATSPNWTL